MVVLYVYNCVGLPANINKNMNPMRQSLEIGTWSMELGRLCVLAMINKNCMNNV